MSPTPPDPIEIICLNGTLKAKPKRRNVPFGKFTIRWIPLPKANVTSIIFTDPNAPFSTPTQQKDGTWTSEDHNDNTSGVPVPWTYNINGTCSGGPPISVDPEIVNDPQGSPGGGMGDEKGGGRGSKGGGG